MKKFLLSGGVIMSFILYCVYEKLYGAPLPPIPQVQPAPANPPPSVLTQSPVSPEPSQVVLPTNTPPPKQTGYKDGTYIGDTEDAFYGNIQVAATISNGRITTVQFLQYPNDRDTSLAINQQADPVLAQEAIQAQSANVAIVSGATDSSQAFIESMQTILDKAK